MITKKELLNKIDSLKKRLDGVNKDLSKIDLLLDYLGLEIVTEKSIGDKAKFTVNDYMDGICSYNQLVLEKKDIVIYTDKIVKKNGKTKKHTTK